MRALVQDEDKNDRTLAEYAEAYERQRGVRLSRSALHRAMVRLDLPRNKKTLRAGEQDRAHVKQERKDFRRATEHLDARIFVFVTVSVAHGRKTARLKHLRWAATV